MFRDENGTQHPFFTIGATTVLTSTFPTPAASAVLNEGLVRIVTDTDGWFAIGPDPTASDQSVFLPANEPITIHIEKTDKVSYEASVGTGKCYVTGLS